MTELPYRSEHVNDSIADTEDLTNEELGAYVRLQRALWRAGGYLPADQLARFARAGKRWGRLAPAILAKLTVIDGRASCSILLETLLRTRERRANAVEKARKGGFARASKGTFGGQQSGALNAANPLKTHDVALLQAGSKRANQNLKVESSLLTRRGGGKEADSRERENSALYLHGVEVLMARVKLRRMAATSQISKWLSELGDAERVATLIAAVEAENLTGHHVVAVIDQRVKALKSEREKGLPLPFGFQPNVVKK